MKKVILPLVMATSAFSMKSYAQVGISTTTPQKTLHVNGSLQVVNELNVGGNATTAGSAGTAGQLLASNGPGAAPSWQNFSGTGTAIVINGKLIVAQEITAQMTADFTDGSGAPVAIGNLNNVIIDNQNLYTASATSNSFKVSADGVYQVTINGQLSTTNASSPVLGVWDNTANSWIARVNDLFTASSGGLQTYTLITSVPMLASKTYSFRQTNTTASTTLKQLSSGSTGSGPVTQVSVKRLK
ncbi:hypothetical protein [Chryseobacterium sp. ERMR1:04]|uniref:hypothetical protein n=1 Tax=Chryseobacterium sp. ERMR1:04 TaxID=1705393 RepID=UPI0006C86498|nr:hypothetical protein [Chryseobacterium sp. ERMR1:04]KPH14210.1 hypothetical protein AMQ68_01420 [Chryseobacterium sp. ERMR1:04]